MENPRDSAKKAAGFTLLEVLLALALFSLLASSTWLLLSGLRRLDGKAEELAVRRDLLAAALYVRNDVRLFAEGYPPGRTKQVDPTAVRRQPFAWDLIPPSREGGPQEGGAPWRVRAEYSSPDETHVYELYVDCDAFGHTSLRWKKRYEEGRLAVWTRGEAVRFRFFDGEGREIRTEKGGGLQRVEDYLRVEVERGREGGRVLFTPWPLPAVWILPLDEEGG
ncbi:prepilin-type N-terminal cleavage/methylation domain-containing protein [Brockia lithotrophica]|uniref:Prepilin-type N-terminal cleavage/methylation domain-containing protein n=1 Tax=Brockia lithotrophica TaxID=933949 RepID=A0A660L805_9BACL|nr:prepilin-type N-terminal cleavage/methylation domain-containing protein [Brockia lithotrophica]RKQ88962.1 prepilin-type N-terminal cleavage/methylation domain-containing protein [Brockia lithotrophica]